MGLNIAELLKIMKCPACNALLKFENDQLFCSNCQKIYPLINEIPDFIVSDNFED